MPGIFEKHQGTHNSWRNVNEEQVFRDFIKGRVMHGVLTYRKTKNFGFLVLREATEATLLQGEDLYEMNLV